MRALAPVTAGNRRANTALPPSFTAAPGALTDTMCAAAALPAMVTLAAAPATLAAPAVSGSLSATRKVSAASIAPSSAMAIEKEKVLSLAVMAVLATVTVPVSESPTRSAAAMPAPPAVQSTVKSSLRVVPIGVTVRVKSALPPSATFGVVVVSATMTASSSAMVVSHVILAVPSSILNVVLDVCSTRPAPAPTVGFAPIVTAMVSLASFSVSSLSAILNGALVWPAATVTAVAAGSA